MQVKELSKVNGKTTLPIPIEYIPVVLLDLKNTCIKLNMSRTQFFKMRKSDDFPKARRITTKRIGWIESEIDDWIRSRPVAV